MICHILVVRRTQDVITYVMALDRRNYLPSLRLIEVIDALSMLCALHH